MYSRPDRHSLISWVQFQGRRLYTSNAPIPAMHQYEPDNIEICSVTANSGPTHRLLRKIVIRLWEDEPSSQVFPLFTISCEASLPSNESFQRCCDT
jgi:hypothetical protein